jgi:hypothetical protein
LLLKTEFTLRREQNLIFPVDVTFDLYSVIITTVFKMARAVSGYLMGIQKLLIEDRQCHDRRKKDNKMSSLNENRGQIQVLRKHGI